MGRQGEDAESRSTDGARPAACDDYRRIQEIYERFFPGTDGVGSQD